MSGGECGRGGTCYDRVIDSLHWYPQRHRSLFAFHMKYTVQPNKFQALVHSRHQTSVNIIYHVAMFVI